MSCNIATQHVHLSLQRIEETTIEEHRMQNNNITKNFLLYRPILVNSNGYHPAVVKFNTFWFKLE